MGVTYLISRAVLCMLAAVLLLLPKKNSGMRLRRRLAAPGAVVAILTVFSLFPPEVAFLSFSSPPEAFAYNNIGRVELTVTGEESALVAAHSGDHDTIRIVAKNGERWKAGIGWNTTTVSHKVADGVVITVYRYRSTNEYYVSLSNTNGGALDITDIGGADLQHTERDNAVLQERFYTYYFYARDLTAGRTVSIDGKAVRLWDDPA